MLRATVFSSLLLVEDVTLLASALRIGLVVLFPLLVMKNPVMMQTTGLRGLKCVVSTPRFLLFFLFFRTAHAFAIVATLQQEGNSIPLRERQNSFILFLLVMPFS